MAGTLRMAFPLLTEGQDGAEITVNDGLVRLDALAHCRVLDKDLNDPPSTPTNGDAYLVGVRYPSSGSPSGAWTGKTGNVAIFSNGAWIFQAPIEGMLVWVADEKRFLQYFGSAWRPLHTNSQISVASASTVTLYTNVSHDFKCVLGHNITFSLTGTLDGGEEVTLKVQQDATGGRTIAFDSSVRYNAAIPSPTISSTANSTSYIRLRYNAEATKWDVVSIENGFGGGGTSPGGGSSLPSQVGQAGKVLSTDGSSAAWVGLPTHAASHQSGGGDAIKLDDLGTPDDNTDLDASTSRHGLLPKLPNDSAKFLNGLGSWAIPSGDSGGTASIPLDYTQNVDYHDGTSVTSGTYYKLCDQQTFTLSAASKCLIILNLQLQASATDGFGKIFLNVDGTRYAMTARKTGNGEALYDGGVIALALASGTHTIDVEYYHRNGGSGAIFLRSGTVPTIEGLRLTVLVIRG